MAKKRELPNLVENIIEETRQVEKEVELINKSNVDVDKHKHVDVYNDKHNDVDKHVNVDVTIEKRKKKNANLQILINDELKERLRTVADAQGVSMGHIIVTLVENYLNSVESK